MFRMADNNSCRLCFSSDIFHQMEIFSNIGIELKMKEIISEHFKCEVNKNLLCQ